MSSNRALLRLVPTLAEAAPDVLFCGHCGEPPPTLMAARSRVCARCGLGVMIGASGSLAPKATEPFVIIDGTLSLCAVSRTAERLLCISEPEVINRHVAEYLEPADAEALDGDELLQAIIAVAGGRVREHTVVVRPTGEYGVRYTARIGRCGPPSAALLVLSDSVV